MTKYIYSVGKPYPHSEALDTIRRLGYKAGLFLDKNQPSAQAKGYDKVVELDFSSNDSLMRTLPTENLQVGGLICSYENYLLAKSWLGMYLGVPTTSLESAQKSTDKYLMRQAFMSADSSITPNFAIVNNEDEALGFASRFSYPLIIKPTNLVKSLLVIRCDNETELRENFAYAQREIHRLYEKYNIYNRKPTLVIEEFMEGKLCSVAAFVDEKGKPHFCQNAVSLVNAHDISVDDNYLYARHLPAKLDERQEKAIFEVAIKGIAALGMTSTPAHIEIIYNESEIRLVEIGARIGGYRPRMYQASYGINMIEQEINLAIGKTPNTSGEFTSYCSVFELFPPSEGEFDSLTGLDNVSEYSYFSLKAKPGQKVGLAKNGFKATAIAIVSSTDESKHRQLCRSVDNIQIKVR